MQRHFSEEIAVDRLGTIQNDLEDLNRIMVRNIGKMIWMYAKMGPMGRKAVGPVGPTRCVMLIKDPSNT